MWVKQVYINREHGGGGGVNFTDINCWMNGRGKPLFILLGRKDFVKQSRECLKSNYLKTFHGL